MNRVKARIKVDGEPFYAGKVSCVLVGNIGKILGGIGARKAVSKLKIRVHPSSVTIRGPDGPPS